MASRSRLAFRIGLSLLLLVGLTLLFVGSVVLVATRFGAAVAPTLLVPSETGADIGTTLGVVVALGIVLGTFRLGTNVVRNRFDTRPISETAYADDRVLTLVERLTLQLDVPTPAVEVAETTVPHASVSGVTRSGATLVISEGLLDRLDGDQLAAVLAHELAHLANRDALVVTLVAVPAVFGRSVMDGLNATNDNEGVPGALTTNLFGIAAFLLAGCIWLVGRSMLAIFARQRELAADRAAARLVEPAAVAEALDVLDPESVEAPATDVRQSQAVSAFSIVESPEPSSTDFTIWAGGRRPPMMRLRNWFVTVGDTLFATHPPTEKRKELLQEYEQE